MAKSATDVMHEIILSAVRDSLDALKSASKGVPNTMLRDINAIHANAAFDDLPRELQAAISTSVRSAFNRLLKEGYSVSQGAPAPMRSPAPHRPAPHRPAGSVRRPPRPGGKPPRGTRPPRKS